MRRTFKLLPIAICLFAVPAAAHAGGLVLSGVDGISSTVLQQHQSSFSGLALRARVRSDRLIQGIVFMPTMEWWRASNSIQAFGIETMRKDATLGLDARYDFRRAGVRPYLGAGFGMHFISNRVNAPTLGLDNATNSLIKGGLSALGGVSFGITSKIDNFLELKYHHIPEYSQLKFNWGLAYSF